MLCAELNTGLREKKEKKRDRNFLCEAQTIKKKFTNLIPTSHRQDSLSVNFILWPIHCDERVQCMVWKYHCDVWEKCQSTLTLTMINDKCRFFRNWVSRFTKVRSGLKCSTVCLFLSQLLLKWRLSIRLYVRVEAILTIANNCGIWVMSATICWVKS